MAHKKGQGSTRNGRDSNPKYLGVKLYDGQPAKSGSIVARQRGTAWHPGYMIGRGSDDTLFALCAGTVVWKGSKVHIKPSDPAVPTPFYL